MTRKDYVLIANAIRQRLNVYDGSPGLQLPRAAVVMTAVSIADALATDNPNFKRMTFFSACGLADSEQARL